ncbi:MAG: cobalamin B12-binding domain-containing protein [Kofleriaceae bacterium]|nr:cobalamin B12-binding domain-containing protein [Kofleriaceae bacterium]
MIRWCSYCQAFCDEQPPYHDLALSHVICPACEVRLERDEQLIAETEAPRLLMKQIFRAAARGDAAAIDPLLAGATALGLTTASLLLGVLQPLLHRTGRRWQAGAIAVADEHQITAWCERAFARLPVAPPPPRAPLDLLLLVAPGNTHTLGPRFAATALRERGLRVHAIVPELPIDDVVDEVVRLRPAIVGMSCATTAVVPDAVAQLTTLRARLGAAAPRVLLGGMAARQATPPPAVDGVPWIATVGQAEAAIRAGAGPAPDAS